MSYRIGTVVDVIGEHTMAGQIGRVCRVTKYTYWVRFWVSADNKDLGAFYVPIPRDLVTGTTGAAPPCRDRS